MNQLVMLNLRNCKLVITLSMMIMTRISWKILKPVSYERNCGAALVEDYNRVIKYYQLS